MYFGDSHVRKSRPGLTPNDRVRMVSLVVVACGFLLLPFVLHSRARHPEVAPEVTSQVDARRPEVASRRGASDPSGLQITDTEPLEVPDLKSPVPSRRFESDPTVLSAVVDGFRGGTDDTLANRIALDYLFHRWLAGADVGVPQLERLPPWQDFANQAPAIRGHRYRLYLTLLGEPAHFTGLLPGGGNSGVERFWDVYGRDPDGHMHRIVAAEKQGSLFDGTAIEVDVDFWRVHEFRQANGGIANIPAWCAARLERFVPPSPLAGWNPVFWIIVLSFGGLLIAAVILWRQTTFGRFEERRAAARGSGSRPAPDIPSPSSSSEP